MGQACPEHARKLYGTLRGGCETAFGQKVPHARAFRRPQPGSLFRQGGARAQGESAMPSSTVLDTKKQEDLYPWNVPGRAGRGGIHLLYLRMPNICSHLTSACFEDTLSSGIALRGFLRVRESITFHTPAWRTIHREKLSPIFTPSSFLLPICDPFHAARWPCRSTEAWTSATPSSGRSSSTRAASRATARLAQQPR